MSNPFIRASAAVSAEPFIHAMIVGESGSGKTSWAARSPRPLVILTEAQGAASIVAVNPDAIVVNTPTWSFFAKFMSEFVKRGKTVTLENGQAAFRLSKDGHTVDVQTIVIDGLTDLQRMLVQEFKRETDDAMASVSDMSVDNMSAPMWGRVSDYTGIIARDLRSLPVNTIFTTLADVVVEEGTGKRTVQPSLQTKVKGQIGQYCSLVAYAETVPSRTGVARRLWFERPGYPAKPAPGFPSRIDVTLEPGVSTLGSLALAYLPVDKSRIPATPDDHASKVLIPEAPTAPGAPAPAAQPARPAAASTPPSRPAPPRPPGPAAPPNRRPPPPPAQKPAAQPEPATEKAPDEPSAT